MKIIKPEAHFLGPVPTGYAEALQFIEMAGRTCYKSEDKITAESAEPFVQRLIKAGHLAMVEHSNFVVKCHTVHAYGEQAARGAITELGKYLNYVIKGDTMYIGGSLTAWYQRHYITSSLKPSFIVPFCRVFHGLFSIAPRLNGSNIWEVCPQEEIPKELERISARFICDRGVSHELVRHRPCSFAQESTRYVNYGGKDMEFIEPAGFEDWVASANRAFVSACRQAERNYSDMLCSGLKPQQARAALTNALKTEIIVTADRAEWAHIRKLREAPGAHPDMIRVIKMLPDFL